MPTSTQPTASIIIIGNEILSGRTLDSNTHYIATQLAKQGIALCETRTIPDDIEMIVETVRELKARYDHVFTTGGIGPTHDDKTAEAIALAFKVPLVRDKKAESLLQQHYKGTDKLNEARLKMANMPEGARHITNPISLAPGFYIENVYVMAGIPSIMQAMFSYVLPLLTTGEPFQSLSVRTFLLEGDIATDYEALQSRYPTIDMGSYPFTAADGRYGTVLAFRSNDPALLHKAFADLMTYVQAKTTDYQIIDQTE